jgi:hypothetical protein
LPDKPDNEAIDEDDEEDECEGNDDNTTKDVEEEEKEGRCISPFIHDQDGISCNA